MGNRISAGCLQAGAISTTLVALAGFAAGALAMALVSFGSSPSPAVGEAARAPQPAAAAHDPASVPMLIQQGSELPMRADPPAWPYEAKAPTPAAPPGRTRPDRLSAPEGWSYDGRGRSD